MARREVKSVFRGMNNKVDPLLAGDYCVYCKNADLSSGKLKPLRYDNKQTSESVLISGVSKTITNSSSTTLRATITGVSTYPNFNVIKTYDAGSVGWVIDRNTYFCRYPIDGYDIMYGYRSEAYTWDDGTSYSASSGLFKYVDGDTEEYQVGSVAPTVNLDNSPLLSDELVFMQEKTSATADGLTPLAPGDYYIATTIVFDQNGWTFETAPTIKQITVTAAETDNYIKAISVSTGSGADWASYPDAKYLRFYKLSGITGNYELIIQHTINTSSNDVIDFVSGVGDNALWDGSVTDNDLGATITTYFFADETGDLVQFEAPPTLDGICETQYQGMLIGWKDEKIYWSYPGYPDAWPSQFSLNCPEEVTFIETGLSGVIVVTENQVFNIYATSPYAMQLTESSAKRGCEKPFGYSRWNGGVVFISDEGLVYYNGVDDTVLTEQMLNEPFWQSIISSSVNMYCGDRYCLIPVSNSYNVIHDLIDSNFGLFNVDSATFYLGFCSSSDLDYSLTLEVDGGNIYYYISEMFGSSAARDYIWVSSLYGLNYADRKNYKGVEYDLSPRVPLFSGNFYCTSLIYLDTDYYSEYYDGVITNTARDSTTQTMTFTTATGNIYTPLTKLQRTHKIPRNKKTEYIQISLTGNVQVNSMILSD